MLTPPSPRDDTIWEPLLMGCLNSKESMAESSMGEGRQVCPSLPSFSQGHYSPGTFANRMSPYSLGAGREGRTCQPRPLAGTLQPGIGTCSSLNHFVRSLPTNLKLDLSATLKSDPFLGLGPSGSASTPI